MARMLCVSASAASPPPSVKTEPPLSRRLPGPVLWHRRTLRQRRSANQRSAFAPLQPTCGSGHRHGGGGAPRRSGRAPGAVHEAGAPTGVRVHRGVRRTTPVVPYLRLVLPRAFSFPAARAQPRAGPQVHEVLPLRQDFRLLQQPEATQEDPHRRAAACVLLLRTPLPQPQRPRATLADPHGGTALPLRGLPARLQVQLQPEDAPAEIPQPHVMNRWAELVTALLNSPSPSNSALQGVLP